jgi:hypothetical protein
MKKLLMVAPHLSTGGLPQYLLKQLESFISEYEIYVIEWSDITGGVYVVQKNKIFNLIGNRLITLSDNKNEFIDLINQISPDVIHFQEIPESFIDVEILKTIYNENRNYFIVVTTHSSTVDVKNIKYSADKFILVSEWSKSKFKDEFGSEICDIWEYPIEKIVYDKDVAKSELGFDKEYKHILNVGLFTPGKNQKELIELAKTFLDDKIIFHFVGNQADNFSDYWKPLMIDLPKNCIIHGERSDVDKFYKACDLFYFTSNFELNPLSVRESISYGLPTFIKNLKNYENSYDGLVTYISSDLEENRKMILNEFKDDSIAIVLAHCDNEYRVNLLKKCLGELKCRVILSCNYPISEEIQKMCDYVIYTKDNPLLYKEEYEKYSVVYNYWYINEVNERVEIPFDFEHSYAVYKLIRNGLQIALNLGIDNVHIINYDYQIDKLIIDENDYLLRVNDIVFYLDNNTSYSTGFFSGKIDKLKLFFDKYLNRHDFYKDTYNVLEKRIYDFFQNKKDLKIIEGNVQSLKESSKVNQEGLFFFSNENKKKLNN